MGKHGYWVASAVYDDKDLEFYADKLYNPFQMILKRGCQKLTYILKGYLCLHCWLWTMKEQE